MPIGRQSWHTIVHSTLLSPTAIFASGTRETEAARRKTWANEEKFAVGLLGLENFFPPSLSLFGGLAAHAHDGGGPQPARSMTSAVCIKSLSLNRTLFSSSIKSAVFIRTFSTNPFAVAQEQSHLIDDEFIRSTHPKSSIKGIASGAGLRGHVLSPLQ